MGVEGISVSMLKEYKKQLLVPVYTVRWGNLGFKG